jgi:hypothetical protein
MPTKAPVLTPEQSSVVPPLRRLPLTTDPGLVSD